MNIKINPEVKLEKLNNFWNHVHFHPTDAIEDEWGQRILNRIHKDNVAKTVRMYAMLEDIVTRDENGKLVYDFTLNDIRLDFLVSKGFDILLSYNFIPPCISSDAEELSTVCKNATRYKGKFIVTAPPEDFSDWDEICLKYTEHIVERYGIEEVSRWKLQCMNEPDYKAFFMAKAKTIEERCENYCRLYKGFEAALMKVSERLCPIGPALADNFTFFELFLNYVKDNNLRLDYICFHSYGVHPHRLSQNGLHVNDLYNQIKKRLDVVEKCGFSNTPMILDEWGAATCGYFNSDENPDLMFRETEIYSAYYAKMIIEFQKKHVPLDKMLICLAGQHEMKIDFSGFRNFFTLNNFPKPIYNAYALASHILGEKIETLCDAQNENFAALSSADENGVCIFSVYAAEDFKAPLENLKVTYDLSGIKNKSKINIYKIDKDNANAYSAFVSLGAPEKLSQNDIDFIMNKAELKCEQIDFCEKLELEYSENAVILIEIKE